MGKEQTDQVLEQVHQRLEDLLISRGLLSKDQLEVAFKQQKENPGVSFEDVLIDLGFITSTALAEAFSEVSGIKSLNLRTATLDANLIRTIPKNIAFQYKIVPIIMEDENKLSVATADVYNIVAFDQIKKYFGKTVRVTPLYANELEISEVLDKYYEYEMSIEGILKEIEASKEAHKQISGEIGDYVNPTVRLVDAIMLDAIKRGASDIHFEPEHNFVRLRYRIDGVLMPISTFHKDYWSAIVVRIKIMSEMNIADVRTPQDGRVSYTLMGKAVDFRISSQPTAHGENIVARVLDRSRALMKIEELGLSEHNVKLLKKALKRPEGIIIVSGPTGCGKTTTLYSILQYLNTVAVNIMTLEDPIEYLLSLIRQSNAREGTPLDFANGIRSMLRQDPDIIFVGEVRDSETANMTIRASMTGHQVFATLHTNDSFGIIPRIVDLGVRPMLLSGNIICSIAQRLARKLCNACKTEYTPSEEEAKILGLEVKDKRKVYKHNGCDLCYHSGYKGQIPIHEVLVVDQELDDMIGRESSRKEMMEYAKNNGFLSMADDGIAKILEGVTDLDEIISTVNLTYKL